jgi:hypothetical protein
MFYFVFDVESIGLHGEGFAVGVVVADHNGVLREEKLITCDPMKARGTFEDRLWVEQNIPKLPVGYGEASQVRTHFWRHWEFWRDKGATMWADCAFPVETNFLADCIKDEPARAFVAPYPLHDIATLALICGVDPTETQIRLVDEKPVHNPLKDARQSARLLMEYLQELKGDTPVNRL